MDHDIIMAMMDKMAQTGITKLSYKKGDMELKIENQSFAPTLTSAQIPVAEVSAAAPVVPSETALQPASKDDSVKEMTSPLIGTFYSSPSPEMAAYVKVGDTVKKGQVLGIVEAMKLMNEIESEFDGEITEILVENEQTVEYGQPLFLIKVQ
ncbi:MAG: acetyl-CoA carboxylase biotin carboxyl carrier protein [Lachnospiraceae bacterium]|nr:acetyl-CoA carboxylase biotin carboxyl carrier protein [Lachnospiraceae bacterium]